MNELHRPLSRLFDPYVNAGKRVLIDVRNRTRSEEPDRNRLASLECEAKLDDPRFDAVHRCRDLMVIGQECRCRLDQRVGVDASLPPFDQFPFCVLLRSQPQIGRLQSSEELPTRNGRCAEIDREFSRDHVDVVVITLKAEASTTEVRCKLVKLVQVAVGNEVAPVGVSPRPTGVVDEHGHPQTVARRT